MSSALLRLRQEKCQVFEASLGRLHKWVPGQPELKEEYQIKESIEARFGTIITLIEAFNQPLRIQMLHGGFVPSQHLLTGKYSHWLFPVSKNSSLGMGRWLCGESVCPTSMKTWVCPCQKPGLVARLCGLGPEKVETSGPWALSQPRLISVSLASERLDR
jgi:hypothetical protein